MAMMLKTANLNNEEYRMLIVGDPLAELPSGFRLPRELGLQSAHHNERGIYLGRSWFLEPLSGPYDAELISFGEIETSLERALQFLSHHGYAADRDGVSGLFVREANP